MRFGKFADFIAIATVITGIATAGITGAKICHNTDHLTQYCPLNYVFGINHQINKVNHDYKGYGIQAYKVKDGTVTLKTSYITVIEDDGEETNYIPEGFHDENGEYVNNITLPFNGDIAITEGIPIFPEGAKPGDIVLIDDIEIIGPKLKRVITRPGKKIEPTEDMYDETIKQRF